MFFLEEGVIYFYCLLSFSDPVYLPLAATSPLGSEHTSGTQDLQMRLQGPSDNLSKVTWSCIPRTCVCSSHTALSDRTRTTRFDGTGTGISDICDKWRSKLRTIGPVAVNPAGAVRIFSPGFESQEWTSCPVVFYTNQCVHSATPSEHSSSTLGTLTSLFLAPLLLTCGYARVRVCHVSGLLTVDFDQNRSIDIPSQARSVASSERIFWIHCGQLQAPNAGV